MHPPLPIGSAFPADYGLPLLASADRLDHGLPLLSALIFFVNFAYTKVTLGGKRGIFSPWLNLGLVGAGFLVQTAFLVERGEIRGRCPLTNLFEVITFLGWGLVLFYLLTGNLYRLSPLGLFTAPFVCLLQVFAHFFTRDTNHYGGPVNPWLEFHAAFSVLSFGAFALAGLAGGMYLWQERQLKTHRLRSGFFQLPPIGDLGRLNARLLTVGFLLLSLGLLAGFNMGTPNTLPHLLWAVVIWVLYAFLVQARWGAWRIGPRRVASLSVAAFTVALLTLGGLSFVAV